MPKRVLTLSQNKFPLFCEYTPPEPAKTKDPVVKAVPVPVPPLATPNVPPAVIVPALVIGPPVKVRPVVPPLTLTLVTVPTPLTVSHDGALVPLDTST
jgi:hypothetical protein